MKYKTLIIGAITLGALSLANANANRVDNSGDITLGHLSSAKENPNGPENARYGKVEFKNLTSNMDYTIEPDNEKSKYGAFLIRNPITVKPGETAILDFSMDYGQNAAAEAEANVHCESNGEASVGGFNLFVGGKVSGHYKVEASCEAAASLKEKAYLGIVAESHPVAKVTGVLHDRNKGCTASYERGSISVNPITYSVAIAHEHLDNMLVKGGAQIEKTYAQNGYVTNNNFEPGMEIAPTVNVFSPTWKTSKIKKCPYY
ncbi:hypothetical protein [Francisella adeliensis]|uniref:Uncharacterized protein n=1 Tax=Francisella adeliensis TaxID=2007306 RepID=A0A2Z4Y1R2_9GAMM|nr:hypothetical protein [Francisella adeliensis]AXA34633.1 hypothetical protein CDH04_09595 [Francisella adeliensis]MBK2086360.1 hypothetical protein [Francisella adeliensis]MBK2096575.1 hypothetical protein [Francisella adeliensis]QIW12878.1 hypothetical protein FZC43_09605 [Francisella adeliensis]QIW14754.1 hypothetical protein FZC44_09595 [Francisella adeliensis]